jgi:hypothetical protein
MATRNLLAITPFLAALLGVVALAGCDGGLSTQEAIERCKIEQMNSTTVTPESVTSCVACYEQCGDQCKALGKTPEEYACPQ